MAFAPTTLPVASTFAVTRTSPSILADLAAGGYVSCVVEISFGSVTARAGEKADNYPVGGAGGTSARVIVCRAAPEVDALNALDPLTSPILGTEPSTSLPTLRLSVVGALIFRPSAG